MTPTPGASLLHYRLVEKIGEGGMGEVWKAADTTLGRDVAIKFLPASLATDPERLARFEREARVLASLNHPNIAAIYGLHDAAGTRFLAMELVPGEDLSQRLARGAMPAAEAADVARQIAEALEAAHDQGIVHRDLKPANVKTTPEGRVKVLDFGLAKALDPVASGPSPAVDSRMSPTVTSLGSIAGVILGTAAYMSPEQAKGRPVDRRTDIWAFGCILYEMLSGRRPFDGDGVSEVLAAVIMAPIAFEALPASVPEPLRRLVRRCLERDPRRRLRDIGEARLALEDLQAGKGDEAPSSAAAAPQRATRRSPLRSIAALGGTAIVTAAVAFAIHRATVPLARPAPHRRFEIPAQGPFRSPLQGRHVAISPDGRAVAYVEAGKLLVRPLSRIEPVVLSATAEIALIFWSPDSAFVGYVGGGKIWKAPSGGGESTAVADLRNQIGGGVSASWCPDGRIVFGTGEGGLFQVASSGGDSREIVPVDPGHEADIHDATCLPDNSILFVPHLNGGRPSALEVFAGGRRKELLKLAADQDIWFPAYSSEGYVLFHRHPSNTGIWAVKFSLARHEIEGEPFLVAADGDVPSVSTDGTLVYVSGSATRQTRMTWVDRAGKAIRPIGPAQEQWPFPELSPDGRFVAIAAKENDVDDVWIHDVERGTRTRLSAVRPPYSREAWSGDGRTLLYSEGVAPPLQLHRKNADGSGAATLLRAGWSPAFSADGRWVVFSDFARDTQWDVLALDLRPGGAAVPLVQGKAIEMAPSLSPDGRYLAYVSDESGPYEIYLKRFPGGEGRWQVSTGGGMWPRFSRKGDKIWYTSGDAIMEVDASLGAEPKLGAPRALFRRKPLGWPLIFGWDPGFDVSADGGRFVVVEPLAEAKARSGILVDESWSSGFGK